LNSYAFAKLFDSAFDKNTAHHINEALGGVKIIKSFGIESRIIEKSREYFQLLREVRIKTDFYQYILGHVFEPVGIAVVVLFFLFYQKLPGFNVVTFAAIVYLIEKCLFIFRRLRERYTPLIKLPRILKCLQISELRRKKIKKSAMAKMHLVSARIFVSVMWFFLILMTEKFYPILIY